VEHAMWRRGLVVVAASVLVAAACTTTDQGGADKEVKVIGTWADAEQEAFLAMVKPWEESTGNTVKYTGTRDLNAVLTTGVASGILPDLAGLPGPGQLVEYGVSLDANNRFSRAHASIAAAFRTMNTRRNRLPGSHPYEKKSAAQTKYLTAQERNQFIAALRGAYADFLALCP